MRLYTFANMYLSPIQHGIQSAHVTHDLFVKYKEYGDFEMNAMLFDWAENHKTMIVLNGGYSSTLSALYDMFDDSRNPYPFTNFFESEDALCGALTCVGIVLPEKIYEGASVLRNSLSQIEGLCEYGSMMVDGETVEYTNWEAKLMQELNNYHLA